MTEVFADTSGWASFFVRTEPFHDLAKTTMLQWRAEEKRILPPTMSFLAGRVVYKSAANAKRATN